MSKVHSTPDPQNVNPVNPDFEFSENFLGAALDIQQRVIARLETSAVSPEMKERLAAYIADALAAQSVNDTLSAIQIAADLLGEVEGDMTTSRWEVK